MARTGWRDEVSDVVEQDYDELFAAAVDMGMQQTDEDGRIPPFVLERDHDGETSVRVAAAGSEMTGESLPNLYRSDETTSLRALAFTFEIVAGRGRRALCVWLESREASIQIVQEFRVPDAGTVDLLGVRAGWLEPRVEWG